MAMLRITQELAESQHQLDRPYLRAIEKKVRPQHAYLHRHVVAIHRRECMRLANLLIGQSAANDAQAKETIHAPA